MNNDFLKYMAPVSELLKNTADAIGNLRDVLHSKVDFEITENGFTLSVKKNDLGVGEPPKEETL